MASLKVKSSHFVSRPNPKKLLVVTKLLPINDGKSHIFALIKILGSVDENRQRLSTIIEDHLKRFQQTMTVNVNVPRRFEQVLQAINEDISHFMKEGVHIPLKDLNAVIGVFHDQQIFLSGLGSLSALFMHRTAKQRYVIYELDKQFSGDDPSWDKPFITVLDGELHPGDVFYLGTKLSGREIRIGDLQDILVTLPPSGALKRIQQHVQTSSSYGGVAFQILDKVSSGPPKKVNPFSSIERLGKTKNETAELLGEQSPDIGGWISRVTAPAMSALSSPGTSGPKSIAKRILRMSLKAFIAFIAFTVMVLKQTTELANHTYKYFKNRSTKPTDTNIESEKAKTANILTKLSSISPIGKYIALGSLIVILLLVGTVSLMNSSTSRKETQVAFDTIVVRIEEKKNAAEASLIYNDKDQARTLLSEAVTLLETLPASNNDDENQIENLRSDLNQVFYILRGVTEIKIQTLSTILNETIISSVEADGNIYSFTSDNSVYRFNELDLSFEKIETSSGSIANIQTTTGEGANILFTDEQSRLGRADIVNTSLNPIVSGLDKLSSVTAITLYNDSLYALSGLTQQIIKMRPQGTGFEAGTNWITSLLSNISTARSLAIDGDIYVLLPNDILRFSSGKELSFSFESVDPALSDAKEIWTSVNTDYVYVLDPSEARVIVYDKSGDLIAQYVNEALREGQNIIVRENKASILISTNDSLLQFTAIHLVQ